jgi:hypothetical protein
MALSFSRTASILMGAALALACNAMPVAAPDDNSISGGQGQGADTTAVAPLQDDDLRPLDDLDGDGVPNREDNCPATYNPLQEDTDGDGVGDACDICPLHYDPEQADENDNGIGDACENDEPAAPPPAPEETPPGPLCPNGDDLCALPGQG